MLQSTANTVCVAMKMLHHVPVTVLQRTGNTVSIAMKMLHHVTVTVLQRTGNTVSVAMKMLQPVPPGNDATGSQKAFYQVCTAKRHIFKHFSYVALCCTV